MIALENQVFLSFVTKELKSVFGCAGYILPFIYEHEIY